MQNYDNEVCFCCALTGDYLQLRLGVFDYQTSYPHCFSLRALRGLEQLAIFLSCVHSLRPVLANENCLKNSNFQHLVLCSLQ